MYCTSCGTQLPDDADSCSKCGELQKASVQLDEARLHLEQAYAADAKDDPENALRECELSIRLDPSNAEAHNLRGIVLEDLGRKEEAFAAYQEAVRLDPDLDEAKENLLGLDNDLRGDDESNLVEMGLDQESASITMRNFLAQTPEAQRRASEKNMLYGALWCIGGIIVTAATYAAASGGGTYIIAWGAIIFGAIQFFRGLSQYNS